jgi:hypothetical protein
MAVSASDPLVQVPGFQDRLGERVVVPQPSGALLEYLHFREELTSAPFFESALKERISRLANFHHGSYCRVRRIQHVIERGGRPSLVSTHVAGRRLSEILEVAHQAHLQPSTSAVLAVTRQLMASVALLHDFAPDVFHGALGPERLIIADNGRTIVAEHVLGAVVEQAAGALGARRLWKDFGVAVPAETNLPQFGRRTDILQIGVVTLSALLGRVFQPSEYPDELAHLLEIATETTPGGAAVPLLPGLRSWLERTLFVATDSGFKSLLEAQKAFTQLIQEEGYGASLVAWDGFVEECEVASAKLPAVVVLPEQAGQPPSDVPPAADTRGAIAAAPATTPDVPAPQPAAAAKEEGVATGAVEIGTGADSREAITNELPAAFVVVPPPAAGGAPVPGADGEARRTEGAPPAGSAGQPAASPGAALVETDPKDTGVVPATTALRSNVRDDPFGPWPAPVPVQSAATLLDAFQSREREGKDIYAEVLAAPPANLDGAEPATIWANSSDPEPRPQPAAPIARPAPLESAFETPREAAGPTPQVVVMADDWHAGVQRSATSDVPQSVTAGAPVWRGIPGEETEVNLDRRGRNRADREQVDDSIWEPEEAPAPNPIKPAADRELLVRVLVLAGLVVVATAAIFFAPRLWTLVYEGRRTMGTLTIESAPEDATVTVDGQVRGRTPMVLDLRAGPHELEVQSGGSAVSKFIVIPANAGLTERLAFPEATARGGLKITTYPGTGRVSIDGAVRGTTPLTVADLSPGTHSLLLETPLGNQEQLVLVEPGKVVQMTIPTAAWIRAAAPFDLKVLEDGKVLGTTGGNPVMVLPGPHHFEFINQGLALKIPQFVEVPAGQLVNVALDLPLGSMNMYADQPAEVFVDGKSIGETPLASVSVPLGQHEVLLRNKRYGEVRYTVMVSLAAPVSLTVTFRK